MRNLDDLSNDISKFDLLGKVTVYVFLAILFMMLVLAGLTNNRGKCLYAVWQNIAFMSLVH